MKKLGLGTSPGSPAIKTLSFECKGCMFRPWWGNRAPACHVVRQKRKKKLSLQLSLPEWQRWMELGFSWKLVVEAEPGPRRGQGHLVTGEGCSKDPESMLSQEISGFWVGSAHWVLTLDSARNSDCSLGGKPAL